MIPGINLDPVCDQESRCGCGHLLAILNDSGIEIKCRRCKRIEVINIKRLFRFFKDKEPLSSDPSLALDNEALSCLCHLSKEGISK